MAKVDDFLAELTYECQNAHAVHCTADVHTKGIFCLYIMIAPEMKICYNVNKENYL